MQLNEFSLESQSDNSENHDAEYQTILNFLRMKVLSKGNNIPWNMRKLIILAKAFIEEPYLLFIDENAIDFGKSTPSDLIVNFWQAIEGAGIRIFAK